MSNIDHAPVFALPQGGLLLIRLSESAMSAFVENENIELYRRLIAVVEGDPARDETRYQMLKQLLAEEKAKQEKSLDN